MRPLVLSILFGLIILPAAVTPLSVWNSRKDGGGDRSGGEKTSKGLDKCTKQLIPVLDNVIGVCGAASIVARCRTAGGGLDNPECAKARGPGGGLITQDIMEDVSVGANTPELTKLWHESFEACAERKERCAETSGMAGRIVGSVQAEFVKAAKSCAAKGGVLGVDFNLAEAEFATCEDAPGKKGQDEADAIVKGDRLMEAIRRIAGTATQKELAHWQLHGLAEWAKVPNLPEEEEDKDEEEKEEE